MKSFILAFLGAFLAAQLPAASPTVIGSGIPDLRIQRSSTLNVDLRRYFDANPVVRFDTVSGIVNVELLPDSAPNTVNNFLTYVGANSYANSFIHRSDKPLGVIQGGSFFSDTAANLFFVPTRNLSACVTTAGSTTVTCQSTLPATVGMIVAGAPFSANATITAIANATTFTISSPALSTATGQTAILTLPLETTDTLTNSPGTIAMARTNDPNSATNGWFFNTSASTTSLPPASSPGNDGYAVFGRVLRPADMSVVDAIATFPVPTVSLVINNSTTSNTVVGVASVPAGLTVGVALLGSTIGAIGPGNFIFLNSNANQTITTPTTVTVSRFADPLTQLPVVGNLGSSLTFANLAVVRSVTRVSPFPANASDTSALATFSVINNTNPSLITASVSGSRLVLSRPTAPTGSADISVAVTDIRGGAVQSTFRVTVSPDSSLLDVDGDGIDDFVFQNSPGQIAAWLRDSAGNTTAVRSISPNASGGWWIAGYTDVNGDGIADIIFQNSPGQIAAWVMDGQGNVTAIKQISTGRSGGWYIYAIADISGDGIPDFIFQDSIGRVAAWVLDDQGDVTSVKTISSTTSSGFFIVGFTDVNGDAIPDIIFQNAIGQIAAWVLNGQGNVTSVKFVSVGSSSGYKVVAIADISGDGIPDLIFQNSIGRIAAWVMNVQGNVTGVRTISTGGSSGYRIR